MSENTLCILLYYHTYSMALLISPGVDRSIFVLHIGDNESTLQKNYYSYYMHIIYILCDVGVVFLCQK